LGPRAESNGRLKTSQGRDGGQGCPGPSFRA
jgi:hypothetical protein